MVEQDKLIYTIKKTININADLKRAKLTIMIAININNIKKLKIVLLNFHSAIWIENELEKHMQWTIVFPFVTISVILFRLYKSVHFKQILHINNILQKS